MTKHKVGDTFWYVPNSKWEIQREVTAASVGRKWLHLSNSLRADIVSLRVDGGEYSPPGSLFESKSDYGEHVRLGTAWDDFKRIIDRMYYCPQSMTVEKIAQMTAMLGE